MFGDLDSRGLALLRREPARWLPAALDIARAHALPSAHPHVFAGGTNLVVGLGDEIVLKIFPPSLRHQFEAERLSLALLQDGLSVEVPRIVAEGERDEWPYLAMSRVQGATGEEAWSELDNAAKERLIGRIGEVIAEVQRVPPGGLVRLEPSGSRSSKRRSQDATHITNGWGCRRNSSPASKTIFVTPRRSFRAAWRP